MIFVVGRWVINYNNPTEKFGYSFGIGSKMIVIVIICLIVKLKNQRHPTCNILKNNYIYGRTELISVVRFK